MEWFTRCEAELGGMAFCLLRNRQDAEEALQEAFLKCWTSRQDLERVANPRAWIFTVTLNAARDLRRRNAKRRTLEIEEVEPMLKTRDRVSDALERSEEIERLRRAVGALADDLKEVFLLRQSGELTYDAIALSLSLPLGTVKTRMRRAIQDLRQSLDDGGDLR